MFFTQRILVFHSHLSEYGSKIIGFDGNSCDESDFDLIPVETRISILVASWYMRQPKMRGPSAEESAQERKSCILGLTKSRNSGTCRTQNTSTHTISRPGALPGPRTREKTQYSGRYRTSCRSAEKSDFAIAVPR